MGQIKRLHSRMMSRYLNDGVLTIKSKNGEISRFKEQRTKKT